jgi:hypothetical protein
MHSPLRLMLPLMVQSGEGASVAEAAPSKIVWAFVGTLAAPRTTVLVFRLRQSQGAMTLKRHTNSPNATKGFKPAPADSFRQEGRCRAPSRNPSGSNLRDGFDRPKAIDRMIKNADQLARGGAEFPAGVDVGLQLHRRTTKCVDVPGRVFIEKIVQAPDRRKALSDCDQGKDGFGGHQLQLFPGFADLGWHRGHLKVGRAYTSPTLVTIGIPPTGSFRCRWHAVREVIDLECHFAHGMTKAEKQAQLPGYQVMSRQLAIEFDLCHRTAIGERRCVKGDRRGNDRGKQCLPFLQFTNVERSPQTKPCHQNGRESEGGMVEKGRGGEGFSWANFGV